MRFIDFLLCLRLLPCITFWRVDWRNGFVSLYSQTAQTTLFLIVLCEPSACRTREVHYFSKQMGALSPATCPPKVPYLIIHSTGRTKEKDRAGDSFWGVG